MPIVPFVPAFVAGGVLYAGARAFSRSRPRKTAPWLAEPGPPNAGQTALSEEKDAPGQNQPRDHYFAISTASLGLSVAGALVYPPLNLASIPLTVYASVPLFEEAFAGLFRKGWSKLAIVSSVAVVGAVLTEHYVIASLIDWTHHYLVLVARRFRELNRRLLGDLEGSQLLAWLVQGRPRSVWVLADDVEMEIPFEALKVGDIVVVNEKELVPVDGVIRRGRATVDMRLRTGSAQPFDVAPGNRIAAASAVLSGSICVEVEQLW